MVHSTVVGCWGTLRSKEHILGIPGLSEKDKQKIRIGNLTMRSSAKIIGTASTCSKAALSRWILGRLPAGGGTGVRFPMSICGRGCSSCSQRGLLVMWCSQRSRRTLQLPTCRLDFQRPKTSMAMMRLTVWPLQGLPCIACRARREDTFATACCWCAGCIS